MRIPQYLHKPLQVLWWEQDEFVIVLLLTLATLIFHWAFLIALIVIPMLIGRIKKSFPRGYLKHLVYFAGFMSLKKYPTSFERHFIE